MDTNLFKKINYKYATLLSLAVMLVIMLWVSKDYGISGDEYSQNTYGEKVYDYYASFGKDKSALEYKNVYYYGGFYDLLCVAVNKVLPTDEYNTRHFINAIFGFMAILFTSLLAKRYKGWLAAFVAAIFLFFSPRFFGQSMNNPKDIPFALGMVMSVYFISRFVAAFPKPTWKDALWLALSIGFAIGIRVGGLLLMPFLFVAIGMEYLFVWRKQGYQLMGPEIKRLAGYVAAVCIAGYFSGLIFWPFALEAPLTNPFIALSELSNFSTGIRMLFDDKHIMSQQVTAGYIPTWISITTPIIILSGIVLSPFIFVVKQYKPSPLLFLFFVTFFPWLYIVYKNSPLYDGWRHLLFIYPFLIIISTLAFISIADYVQHKYAKYIVAIVVFIGLLPPARWSIVNHPNQAVYFNETIGGIEGAYGYYETDYYMNSIKQAFYKLADEKDLYNAQDTVIIVTNCIEPMYHYIKTLKNPNVVTDYVRYRERENKKYDYGIFISRFVDRSLLQGGYFPPSNTIMTIDADNVPLSVITKSDTGHIGHIAFTYYDAKDNVNAIIHYQKAIALDPRNETYYINYAIALASVGRIPEAIEVTKQYINMVPEDHTAHQIIAQMYKSVGDMQSAQNAMNIANRILEDAQGGK